MLAIGNTFRKVVGRFSFSRKRNNSFLSTKQPQATDVPNRRTIATIRNDDNDDLLSNLPPQYVQSMTHVDARTFQRTDVAFDAVTGKPLAPALNTATTCSQRSCIPSVEHDYRARTYAIKNDHAYPDRIAWSGLTEAWIRCPSNNVSIPFEQLLEDDGMTVAMTALYRYGLLLITETPLHNVAAAVGTMAACLGGGSRKKQDNPTSLLYHYYRNNNNNTNYSNSTPIIPHVTTGATDGPLRTLYGTVWSTIAAAQAHGASVADSAYGQNSLPLHTDMTYKRDPPGLQIFTMVNPASKGGESIFGDGLYAAEKLRTMDPEAFDTLSQTIRRYRCLDLETGWHMEASGSVISVHNDHVVAVRHNDLDRLADLPPPNETDVDVFYDKLAQAHEVWDTILGEDETRLVMRLQAGDTMVVTNQVRYATDMSGGNICDPMLIALLHSFVSKY
jgi:hypothetical protein